MKGDFKIITILLSIVILHATYTDGWGVRVRIPRVRIPTPRIRIPTPRIRVPNPVRVVRRVVRKAGEGIKTGVRKAGEGIKTGVRKTGEGLKKVGEGLKKAGEVTGKHLYKGLRETGKALITASSFVSDILDRINLMKFIWKKLGACCIFDRSICRAKREYELIQRRLKYYNNEIDKTWKRVESVYQWIIKINENVEDIGYHVERLTSGVKDSVEPLLPPLIIQYNNKMNTIKQDVKWKNSSVIHLTRQGVTAFVQIEMAWKCPKVASSIKDGLKDLKEARDKCVTIQRESNDLLRFFDQGWRQLKKTLSSQNLRQQLGDIKDLCLDIGQSSCVSTIDKYLRQISSANYGTAFGLQEEIINTLAAIKYTFSCLKRKRRVIATASEHCQKGNENFNTVYQQAVRDFFANKELCTELVGKDYTTKYDVLKQIRVFALEKGFYSSCELNNREIITKTCLDYSKLASTYNLPPQESSRLINDCKKIAPGILGKIQCKPGICRNGGKCEERPNSYVCVCPKRFRGKHCEIDTGTEVNVFKLQVRSEGCDDRGKTPNTCGLAFIKINGKDYSKHGRGYNFVVMDSWTGNVEQQVSFDTHANVGHVNNMIKFIQGIAKSKIVLVAIQDEGRSSMTADAYRALLTIGAKEPMKRDIRGSFALVGFSGNMKPGFVQQVDNLRARGPSIVETSIILPYTGKCRSGLCQNGGKCHQEQQSYSCFCAQGFAGRHCESKAEYPVCRYGNWWGSFDRTGWSVCPSTSPYITGLERSKSNGDGRNDFIYHLEAANCCQATIPFINDQHDCVVADWVGSFDRRRTWNTCPRGYYLGGLERSGGHNLHNIERARCCKPRNQPLLYKDCYKENVWAKFDHHNSGMVSCGRKGYFITGLYRSDCDLLYCVEEFMCCSMLSAIEDVKVLKLQVRSEGCDDRGKAPNTCGLAFIKINGKDYSKHGRGYNFVVMDSWTGNVEQQVSFDTHANVGHVNNMIKFIQGIGKSKIVLVAIQDEGQRTMTADAYRALLAIGAKEPMKRDFRGSFALVGFSGDMKPGFVQQVDNSRARGPSIVEKLITLPYTVCRDPKGLGMQNGKIKDSQISASSEWNHHHGANNARLYFRAHSGRTGAWSAKVNDVNQWLQVDFQTPSLVLAISLQGREDCCNQFVRSYTVSWSNDGRTFYPYKHHGQIKVFTGNNDRHGVVQQIISPPIIARYIRVNPKSWNQHISLRLEFIGC